MDEGRARRQSKAPSWMQEVVEPDDALAGELVDEQPQKYVFKLLQRSDINRNLLGRSVFVFWEEYDLWYRAKIKKVDVETATATIFYPDTEEEEPDANLVELIDGKFIAFKETRPEDYQLGPGEVEHSKEFIAPEKKKRGRPPKGQERPRAEYDDAYDDDFEDDEDEAPQESDPSYSGEVRAKKPRGEAAIDSEGRPRPTPRSVARGPRYEEEEGDDAQAQRLLAKAGQAMPGGLQNDAAVRDKVRNTFTHALEVAAQEQQPGTNVPKPAVVASAIEDELVRQYGGTTKEYKAKARTLVFNLKEPGNKELRGHVICGDIRPAEFVRMTANELASKELAEYRQRKQEEALKMSVLDAEAAAKFSTAAALDARDSLALPAGVVTDKLLSARDVDAGTFATDDELESKKQTTFSDVHSDLEHERVGSADRQKGGLSGMHDVDHAPEISPTPAAQQPKTAAVLPSPAAAIDWASVKAQAVEKAPHFMSTTIQPMETMNFAKEDEESNDYLLPSVNHLKTALKPAASSTSLRAAAWSGTVAVPTVGEFHVIADALAGGHDLSALLGPSKVTVRGRLDLFKLSNFLSELHLSKNRLAMLGVLRPPPTATTEERDKIRTMVDFYSSQSRAGVIEPFKGVEVYTVPPGPLASRLLEAGLEAEPDVATAAGVARSAPGSTELLNDQMVAIVVYKKDVNIPVNVPLIVQQPIVAKAPQPMVPAVQPVVQPLPSSTGGGILPAGLDLSAISALAAAFGVAPAGTGPPQQQHPSHPPPGSR